MSANNNAVGIKQSWSLMVFARKYTAMKVTSDLVNKETGETFKSCAFIDKDGGITLVGFSSNLGELTPQQIVAQKDKLQVVQLESGNYKLCKEGTDAWQTVNLGL